MVFRFEGRRKIREKKGENIAECCEDQVEQGREMVL